MEIRAFREYSRILGREAVPCFPPQDGHFYDFGNFGMADTLRLWLTL